ncbi:MAG: Scr1 family TA system antitoxin-like transcriptional regulator [Pseudonocardiaceae bacterium]
MPEWFSLSGWLRNRRRCASLLGWNATRMLDDPSRQWVLLQTEGALWWNLGGSAVMIEQIERIATAIDRPNVLLGIIPWQALARVLPLHGFHLYDHRAVVVGTRSGTAIMGERDVLDYEALFDKLKDLAVFGGAARAALARIADDYRSL